MKGEKPILFSAPMVRALLAGTKTQTRRVFKGIEQFDSGDWHIFNAGGGMVNVREENVPEVAPDYAPIAVGDHLWVREAWRTAAELDRLKPSDLAGPVFYEADAGGAMAGATGKKRPSLFMPRWASRLTLIVTEVRVQRLQDISGNDAQAEGISISGPDVAIYRREAERNHEAARRWNAFRIRQYREVWGTINGPGAWEANPWVVAYTFTVHSTESGRLLLAKTTEEGE